MPRSSKDSTPITLRNIVLSLILILCGVVITLISVKFFEPQSEINDLRNNELLSTQLQRFIYGLDLNDMSISKKGDNIMVLRGSVYGKAPFKNDKITMSTHAYFTFTMDCKEVNCATIMDDDWNIDPDAEYELKNRFINQATK